MSAPKKSLIAFRPLVAAVVVKKTMKKEIFLVGNKKTLQIFHPHLPKSKKLAEREIVGKSLKVIKRK